MSGSAAAATVRPMGSEPTITFARPLPEHLRQVADLRWDWAVERGRPPLRERCDFAREFERWCEQNRATHSCIVALGLEADVVGFGFLAITPRVPAANLDDERLGAEIQAVYVAAELRNNGIGAELVERLINLARQQGAERVTVHSSAGAVTAYHRAGFADDPLTMSQTLHDGGKETASAPSSDAVSIDDY